MCVHVGAAIYVAYGWGSSAYVNTYTPIDLAKRPTKQGWHRYGYNAEAVHFWFLKYCVYRRFHSRICIR